MARSQRGAVIVDNGGAESAAPMDLDGKVAIVTGGTSGIGRATVLALAGAGAQVVVSGRFPQRAGFLSDQLPTKGARIRYLRADLRRERDIERLITRAVEAFGHLDILVNSGGVNVSEEADGPTKAAWDLLFEVNVRGTWLCCRAALPHLLLSQGCIVNLGSVSGTIGVAGTPAYAASKAAVINLTKSLALAYADQGVRVNVVCPGPVNTPMTTRNWSTQADLEAGMDRAAAMVPMRRLANVQEVAGMIHFLVGPRASYINGASIMVDGGKSAGLMMLSRYADP